MTNLYFEQNGNTIAVHAKTDVSVNAWSGVVRVADTNVVASILTKDSDGIFWKTIPSIEGGKGIQFAGGLPNGFTGDIVLFRFVLRAPASSLSFSSDTALYLGDGAGTEVVVAGAPFIPSAGVVYAPSSELRDTVPPESFTPELYRDGAMFGGNPVVLFSARDLDSGIQKYEAREITARGLGDWRIAESPYVINPDVTTIEIRAYDNAGNIRTESLPTLSTVSNIEMYAIAIGAVIMLLLVYTISKWRKNS